MSKHEQLIKKIKTMSETYGGITKGILDAARLVILDLIEENEKLKQQLIEKG